MSYGLENLAPGVYGWLSDRTAHGFANAGVVIADDGLTVIDTTTTPQQVAPLAQQLAALTDLPVRRIVLSSSHVGYSGGCSTFSLAAIYGSGQTSDLLDQPADPSLLARLHPGHASDFAELITRPVTHVINEPAHLCPASIAIPVAGHQFENLVVQVPGANMIFAGAIASFGITPLGFDADFPSWVATLEQVKGWGEVIIPGQGPIGGREEITLLQEYLQACVDANGALTALAEGPWSAWSEPQFHEINVERAAMLEAGDPSPPPSYRRLLGLD